MLVPLHFALSNKQHHSLTGTSLPGCSYHKEDTLYCGCKHEEMILHLFRKDIEELGDGGKSNNQGDEMEVHIAA